MCNVLKMYEVFAIVLRRSLLNIYDQSRSLGTAVPASSSFFLFLRSFYIFGVFNRDISTFKPIFDHSSEEIMPDRLNFSQFACCDLPCRNTGINKFSKTPGTS